MPAITGSFPSITNGAFSPDFSDMAMRCGIELLCLRQNRMFEAVHAKLRQSNLNDNHHLVLSFVARNPGSTLGSLAAAIQLTKQSLRRALDDLAVMGMIELRRDDEDHRRMLIRLTNVGRSFELELSKAACDILRSAYAQVSPQDVIGFLAVLERLC